MIQFLHLLLILLVVAVWGFNFVVVKVGLEAISPLLLGFWRFFLLCFPAIFFIKRPQVPFRMVILYGLVMFVMQFSLLFMGMYVGVTPGLASLLGQFQVFFTILLAVLFLGENLQRWQILGALIAFSGIALVALNFGGDVTLAGFLLVLGAAASWAFGNVISKKIGKVNILSLVIWGSLIAWPPLLLLSLLIEGPEKIIYAFQNLTWLSGGAILYISYFSTLFGYGSWNWLIQRYNLGIIAPFSLLVPVFGILSSVLIFNEPLQSWKLLAAFLVIFGLCMNLLAPKFFGRKAKI